MMMFKPIDEISLRHLFSTREAEELLGLKYLGPVLNAFGNVETSPDCLILDKRRSPFKLRRCEFKFMPTSASDFLHNGKFGTAIIWTLPNGFLKEKLEVELLEQNGCFEVIVMDEIKAFYELKDYNLESLRSIGNVEVVIDLVKKRESLPSVVALYLAAKLYPRPFRMDRMVGYLNRRFPEVKDMAERGKANVVSAFIQTK
ncbi:MAG: hypothetical protein ACP5U1_16985, partial [Desulfomonilaceae bacterium]